MACYVMNTSGDDNKGAEKCIIPLSDYLECLHHRKEVCNGTCLWVRGFADTSTGREGSADPDGISEMGGGKCGLCRQEREGRAVVGRYRCNDGGEESQNPKMDAARQAELIPASSNSYLLPNE